MASAQELSPQDVEVCIENIFLNKAQLRYGGWKKLDQRDRLALAMWVLRKSIGGMTQTEVARELDISQMSVSRLKDEALAKITLPQVDKARLEYLELCDEMIARYRKMMDTDPDSEKADKWLAKWAEERAKVTGAYAPIEVSATTVEVTAQERELQQMLDQAKRDEAAREAALRAEH